MTPINSYSSSDHSICHAIRIAAALKGEWRAGKPPDLSAVLAEHPSLACHRSIVVDLAIEEYFALESAGIAPDLDSFCERFPSVGASVAKFIAAHRLLDDFPDLLSLPTEPWPESGDCLEGLELLGELGRGASARVYLAFDEGTGRACVVKLAEGRTSEGRLIGGLPRHPHVTDVYWARVIGTRTAVCMPFVGSTTLDALRTGRGSTGADILAVIEVPDESLKAQTSDPVVLPGMKYASAIAAIAARIADALALLHATGLAHSDLKPSNVVLAPGGHPYLIDFHLATGGSVAGGTLPYMAPEVLDVLASGKSCEMAPIGANDMYSFGVVLHELLTGRVLVAPERGELQLVSRLLRDRILAGVTLDPRLPVPFHRVIAACLSIDPRTRPNASEVARQLHGLAGHGSVRGRRMIALTAMLVGVGLLFAGTMFLDARARTSIPSGVVTNPDDLIARGRDRLAKKHYPEASIVFLAASRARPDARLDALIAYCEASHGHQLSAEAYGKKALLGGVRTVAVLNNLGYSLGLGSDPAAALAYLDEAEQMDSQCREVRFNRAFARYRSDLIRGPNVVDARCPDEMRRAVSGVELPAFACRQAADVFAASVSLDPAYGDEAIRWLADAIRHGVNPRTVVNDKLLILHLGARPAFQELGQMATGPVEQSPRVFGLIEPE